MFLRTTKVMDRALRQAPGGPLAGRLAAQGWVMLGKREQEGCSGRGARVRPCDGSVQVEVGVTAEW